MKMSYQVIQRWSKAKNPKIPRSRAQNRAGPPKLAQSKGLGANLAFFSVENHPVLAFFYFKWLTMAIHGKNFHYTRLPISGSGPNLDPIWGQKRPFLNKKPCLNRLQTSPTWPECILTDLRGYRVHFLTISIHNLSTQRRWAAKNMPKKLIFCRKITI